MGWRRVLLGGGGAGGPTIVALERVGVRVTPVVRLTDRAGANAVVETAVNNALGQPRTDWANDNDSLGLHNGVTADFAGSAIEQGGRLDLSYLDLTGLTDLVIDAVRMHFYVRVAGTALNNADVQLAWSKGAGLTTLETITSDVDSLVTPRSFTLPAAQFNSWAAVNSAQAHVRASSGIGELWTAELDAVELEVVAHL